VTNIPYGQIFRVSPDGEFTLLASYDGEPNGLKIHKDGRLFIADHKQGLMLLDHRSGQVEALLDRPHGERFNGLNDLVFAKNGDLYFTDQGESGLHDPTGRLYRLRAGGRLEPLLDNVPSPNGLVLTPNEEILYLAATRNNAIWQVPLLPDGNLGRVGIFIQLSGGMGPDGMAMDAEGNLAVCHVGMGSVWLFSRLGWPLCRDPILHRHRDDQRRLWRVRRQGALHHRKRDRHNPLGQARSVGQANVFAHVRG
jgi:gluconolactonase